MSALWAKAATAGKYLNFNRLSRYCQTPPPWHTILHANLKLAPCKNVLRNYCASKKNITWGNKWSSFKVKCGQDHPPALWLYHSSLLWRDLRRDGPDPRMRDMDNHWKHINIWISLSSNHRLYKHKYSGEVKLRSWTSYNTVILSCGSTGNMSLHTAAESLSSYACA